MALAKGIRIGAAGDAGFRAAGSDGTTFRTVLAREFNAFTPENDMKWDRLRPNAGTYYYASADSLVAFAAAESMQVRGHVLVWHQQLPGWVTGGTWTAAAAESLMTTHIGNVVAHFKGHVVAWDVVNEAFLDDGQPRATFWSNTIGAAYIEKAFHAARAADSTVLLFYNDYNIEHTGPKSDAVYAMLVDFKNRGVPVTGIGFQGHFITGALPAKADLLANFQRFAALGLTIHITELDVRMPVPPSGNNLTVQGQNSRDVVDVCLQVSACKMVTTWGFTDRYSWVPSVFPGFGAALLLDANYNNKPAYAAIHALLSAAQLAPN